MGLDKDLPPGEELVACLRVLAVFMEGNHFRY
jgi:hypothetical protein